MKKNGFTLTELLAVVAIIALIAIIAVPSIIVIRKNMNERIYKEKIELIEKAAETYASNNPDLFNAETEKIITVSELVQEGFLDPDEGTDVINPTCSLSDENNGTCHRVINEYTILIKKQEAGVTAKFNGKLCEGIDSDCQGGPLATQICRRFEDGRFIGKYGTGVNNYCACQFSNGSSEPVKIVKATKNGNQIIKSTEEVDACLIYGDSESNYFTYNNVLWRVIGVYKVDGEIVTKVITQDTVDDK